MKIVLLKDFANKKQGDELTVTASHAGQLIRREIAEIVTEPITKEDKPKRGRPSKNV